MADNSRQVALTILQQLGGNRFIAMTGATSLVSGDNSLTMRIKGAKRGIKSVVVKLESNDLYSVKFFKPGYFRGGKWIDSKWIAEHSGIYCDQLCEIFERETGLYTSL